jgi:hypothetical protein
MRFSSWLRNCVRSLTGPQGRTSGAPRKRPRFRPRLECLEDRWLPSALTVTNNLDSGKGSLRFEIAHAAKKDTIVFAPSLDGQTITLTSGELDITTGLTIQGPGAGQLTISGGSPGNVSRVFDVNARDPVFLSGLTVSGGYGVPGIGGPSPYDGDGGGILNLSTLTLNGCVVSGNYATGGHGLNFGGGIYNAGNLTLTGCTISNNYAWGSNTDFSSGYGGGIYNAGTLTVSTSTLSGNVAQLGDGGGIYNAGTLTVSTSTLSDNFVQGGVGSAIYMGSGNVTVTGCTLTDAHGGYGYFIWVDGGGLTVTNSSFHNPDGLYINGPYTDGGGNSFS